MEINYQDIEKRQKEILAETKPKEEKAVSSFGDFIMKPSFINEAQPLNKTEDYLKAALGWVYSCVSVICDEVASIKLHLYKKNKDNSIEEILDHEILRLLNRANDFTTKFDLFWNTQQYLELAGEAPWLLIRNKSKMPTDILLLRPDLIKVIPGEETFISGYAYQTGMNKKMDLTPEDVVFIKYPDPTRAFRGKGTLQAAAKTVDIDNFSEDFNRNFFYNSAMPGSVLKTDQKLTKEIKKYLEHQIKKLYQGVDKAHKAMILEAGLDWKPMQLSQKDMDFLEQQRFSRDKILGIFRVPRTALGITDDVNRANAEATDYVFARRTIKPKMQRLVEQLNEFLLPQFPNTENLYLDFEDPVPQDVASKILYYESGIRSGFLTINEVREKENMEDIGPDGDRVYISFTVQPIGEAGEKSSAGKNKALEISQRLSARNRKMAGLAEKNQATEKELANKLAPIIRQMLGADNQKKKSNDKTEIYRKFWENKVSKALKLEQILKRQMDGIFDEQKEEILEKMPQKASTDPQNWRLDEKKEAKRTQKITKPTIAAGIKEGGEDGFGLLGLDKELDLASPAVQRFLEKRTYRFSSEITRETNDKLGKILSEGVEIGEGIPELRKRVEQIFEDMKGYRSERIARSETIRASNFGTEQAYRESGVVEAKIWLTAFDERTCEDCENLDGETVDLDKDFADKGDTLINLVMDYEDVGFPPLHPDCRCTIIPKIKS